MTILLLGNTNHARSDTAAPYDMLQIARVNDYDGDYEIVYGVTVDSDTEVISASIDVSSDLDASYSIRWYLWHDFEIPYGVAVEEYITSMLSALDVELDIESSYNIGVIDSLLDVPYSIREYISADIESRYDLALFKAWIDCDSFYGILIEADLESGHDILEAVHSDTTLIYWLKEMIQSVTDIPYDITDTNPVSTELMALYTIYDPTSESIVTDIHVSVDGISIDVDDMSLVADLDSYCWTFTAELSSMADWVLCPAGKIVKIEIGADV